MIAVHENRVRAIEDKREHSPILAIKRLYPRRRRPLMSTWVGAIVETAGRADFWDIARKHRIAPATSETPKYVLIHCDIDFEVHARLAEALSRDIDAMALGFLAQTTVDVHELRAFKSGTSIRRLGYSRDDNGWLQVEGTPQSWERAYFFDDGSTSDDDGLWPDMLWDDITDQDIARFEAARRTGDASAVMDLMHPSSTVPLQRVCESFGVDPDQPHGFWKKRSLLSRLFSR
jgi:hypothetical protein